MVKTVECIGYFINICTNLVRCFFFKCIFDRISEFGKLQHQIFLACIYCLKDFTGIQIAAFFFVAVQNGFDTHDRIKNIRTGISLERSKPVNIKHIILCSLVGKISVFDCRKSYDFCCLFCILIFDTAVLNDLMEHFLIDICNEVFQTHNTTISCLKRFAVFAIHGTEPKERKLCLRFYKTGLSCTAKYLNEMQFLTFIYYIKDLIRIKKFYTFYDRCKISSRIKGSSVRFQKHARRNLFCVTFFFYINNQCTLIFISKSLIFHLLHHIRNVRLCIRFFLPEVK